MLNKIITSFIVVVLCSFNTLYAQNNDSLEFVIKQDSVTSLFNNNEYSKAIPLLKELQKYRKEEFLTKKDSLSSYKLLKN